MGVLLQIIDLNLDFMVDKKRVHILNNVSLEIYENEVLAVIGETGCGKSLTGNAILHLLPDNALVSGSIIYKGQDITKMNDEEFRLLRGKEIAAIPQSPSTSLNPLMRVGNQVAECVVDKADEKNEKGIEIIVNQIFTKLRLPRGGAFYHNYPCELSGGMCQRVLISMGIITNPNLLIVDEPTKALDWALRKEVVEILDELRKESKCSMMFITHDIAAAKCIADRIAVMYCGEVVEIGGTEEVLNNPQHPYTKGLIASMPSRGFKVMKGFMPSFQELPTGCRFSDRCEQFNEICTKSEPTMTKLTDGQAVKCFNCNSFDWGEGTKGCY
ncbi:MAG TPA: ABC transporter ATP-binding protein [Desulfosporosinus sp.]|nr:ABC transporter ATP-binding protein [Desulfosporosinus sp.]